MLRDQIDKAERYLSENPWDKIEDSDKREKEFRFQKSLSDSLMQWTESYIKMCGIMDVYNQLEAAKNKKSLKGRTNSIRYSVFLSRMKLRTSSINSFVMNFNSKELYINMGNDIPLWNDLYSYEEQDDDVKQFWVNEAIKLLNGVTINGVFIHPWLYWHINFWKMMIDVGEDRIPGNSQLRDNEWMFAEFLKQAEEENKGIFMFGCRRFGKALLDSEILYLEDREKMIGNIVVGDKIYDDKGNLVEVVGVYLKGK